jgi:hypothetical protein
MAAAITANTFSLSHNKPPTSKQIYFKAGRTCSPHLKSLIGPCSPVPLLYFCAAFRFYLLPALRPVKNYLLPTLQLAAN